MILSVAIEKWLITLEPVLLIISGASSFILRTFLVEVVGQSDGYTSAVTVSLLRREYTISISLPAFNILIEKVVDVDVQCPTVLVKALIELQVGDKAPLVIDRAIRIISEASQIQADKCALAQCETVVETNLKARLLQVLGDAIRLAVE